MEFATHPHAKVCLPGRETENQFEEVFEGEGAEEEGDPQPPRY